MLLVLAVCLIVLAYLAWGRGCQCPDCTKHVREREQKAADDAVRQHDYLHKGGGWRTGDPDRYSCNDMSCPRNPKR